MKSIITLLFCLAFCLHNLFAQPLGAEPDKAEQASSATLITTDYAFVFPAADMSKRFGSFSMIGGSLLRKTNTNLLWGLQGHFLFGNKLKEDSLAINLVNSDGFITGTDGLPADVNFSMRGFLLTFKVGKIFALNPQKNPNSGIFILGGAGLLQHKIHIEDRNKAVPQLSGKYKQGYDRLSNGPALSQSIGFMNLDRNRLLNFFIALEMAEAFTKNRRAFNFDTQTSENNTRIDLLFGLRLGWILPIYLHNDSRFYTY